MHTSIDMTSTPATLEHFSKSFTRQEALPEASIRQAVDIMQSGRLHRYDLTTDGGPGETSLLEAEFARYQEQAYCLACASGGYALQLALRAIGVASGDPVLTNAFTLSPVPGAITAVGGRPILVESDSELTIDLEHLQASILESGAKVLLLSHMRGHIADMDAILALSREHGVQLVEDCAHTMGATFGGQKSGSHGTVACFSTQTYKHINSGEGGLLTTDNERLAARAILFSGSYMLYERHGAAPPPAAFETLRLETPNCSGRMDELRATILRPQLAGLDDNARRWNERHEIMATVLSSVPGLRLPEEHAKAKEVRSSLQFFADSLDGHQNERFLEACTERGVTVKWFGRAEPQAYTSRHDSWRYIATRALPKTDAVLSRLYDIRIPLTFSEDDCRAVAQLIAAALLSVTSA